jgi:hypothetical protein
MRLTSDDPAADEAKMDGRAVASSFHSAIRVKQVASENGSFVRATAHSSLNNSAAAIHRLRATKFSG